MTIRRYEVPAVVVVEHVVSTIAHLNGCDRSQVLRGLDADIEVFPLWMLALVPVASIVRDGEPGYRGEGRKEGEKVDHYASLPAITAPAVVLRPSVVTGRLEIIDGNHRFAAAVARGDRHIAAFVPLVPGAP